MNVADIRQELQNMFPAGGVLVDAADRAQFESDWRGMYRGEALAVIQPRSTEEVARLVRYCIERELAVVPQGGNTGLVGGAVPQHDRREIVVSMARMNRIREIDTIGNVMIAEAGCVLANLQEAAKQVDRLFPLSLAAQGSCQIGGNVATNAGGTNVLKYGNTRELVLGVEAVLGNGEIFRGLRSLRKDNTGYDLKQLLVGSEGTLGVITAVALKLWPRPAARIVAVAAIPTPAAALRLLELLRTRCGDRLSGFEYFSRPCLELVVRTAEGARDPLAAPAPGYVLIELVDTVEQERLQRMFESALEVALQDKLCDDIAVATGESQAHALWNLREGISEALQHRGYHVKHDISVPIAVIPEFLRDAENALRSAFPGLQPFVFGHFGDGNLHYNIASAAEHDVSVLKGVGEHVSDVLLKLVARYEGSFSAEHGIGQLKKAQLKQYRLSSDLSLIRQIKAIFDPADIMNPGKVLDLQVG